MTILTDTQLETNTYGLPGWVKIYNANIDKLNNLLRLAGLIDTKFDKYEDDAVFMWNGSKWVLIKYD